MRAQDKPPATATVEVTDLTQDEQKVADQADADAQAEAAEEQPDDEEREPLDVELEPLAESTPDTQPKASEPLFDDPSDSDDGEGEWITPSNVGLHKSRALDLLPSGGSTAKSAPIAVGCMSADFAMQNVLLQMDLNLISTDGKRIERVKSWVLRCHACFK